MRHFYLRALIEERMGSQTDWNAVDALMLKALAAAEKVARYCHAQLSAVRLARSGRWRRERASRQERPEGCFTWGSPARRPGTTANAMFLPGNVFSFIAHSSG
jgi:hypothetical protein